MVEVAEIHKDNLLRIVSDGATTQLFKDGLYGFEPTAARFACIRAKHWCRMAIRT